MSRHVAPRLRARNIPNSIEKNLGDKVAGLLLVLVLCLLVTGCGQATSGQYGSSSGSAGRTSMDGFGALRKTYEQAGYKTRDVYRLTDRVGRTNVIVWTPQVPMSISTELTRWFERWLRRGDRTLVYIAPDSGSTSQYWSDAITLAPPKQRLEYRRQLARSLTRRMTWTINRQPIPSNGWFVMRPSSQWTQADAFTGKWAGDGMLSSEEDREILTEYQIEAHDPLTTPPNAGGGSFGATGPASPGYVYYGPTEVTRTKIDFDSLADNSAGESIVAEVTSKNWNGSKIIVVSSGSLVTNYAFSRKFGARLAEKLVAHSSPIPGPPRTTATAGFLTSNRMPIPISERQPGIPKASGMELLTVWPLSLVTIHAAMLGFVICLIMWPVFGRPRHVARESTTNFGDHLDAVAALMSRSGGETFARSRISEYMRRMHGETSGPWVLPEPPSTLLPPEPTGLQTPATVPPPQLDPLDDAASDDLFSAAGNDPFSVGGLDNVPGKVLSSESETQSPTQDSNDDEANR